MLTQCVGLNSRSIRMVIYREGGEGERGGREERGEGGERGKEAMFTLCGQ